MRIADLFYSVQGEGTLVGVPSVFVRTSGCQLRCEWCDTPYTSWEPQGETLSVDDVCARLLDFPTRHAVVTGGEPMLTSEVDILCERLRLSGYHITLETAATIFRPLACDLASLSPKLSNSTPHIREGGRFALAHDRQRLRPDVIRQFMNHCEYQLKFVIDAPKDVDEVEELLDHLPNVDRGKVLLMPQGVTTAELDERGAWVAELCKTHGFRFCPRLHIALYGNRRGT
jgi:7-carboxy-7-deazaguanine synthase